MAPFLLSLSLALLMLLLLFEPVTLRLRYTGALVFGIHLSLFALILSPSEGSARKDRHAASASKRRDPMSLFSALTESRKLMRRCASRFTLSVFTLAAPTEVLPPHKQATATGGYALLLSFFLPLLATACERVRADEDCMLPTSDGCRLDIACSASLFDLLLLGIALLRVLRKYPKKRKKASL